MTDFCVPKLIVPSRSADFISDKGDVPNVCRLHCQHINEGFKNPFIYNVPNFNKGNSPGDIRKNKLG